MLSVSLILHGSHSERSIAVPCLCTNLTYFLELKSRTAMINNKLTLSVLGLIAATVLTACEGNSIEGNWTEPVPGMENQLQGIHLEEGGKASSINMATLQYENWEKEGDKLILSGKSIGNHVTTSFKDTFTIVSLSNNALSLKKGSLTINYTRE